MALWQLAQQLSTVRVSSVCEPRDSPGHASGVSHGHCSTRHTIQVQGGKEEKGTVPAAADLVLGEANAFPESLS